MSLFLSNAILVRAFSPALATSILAYGIERQIVSGQLVWIVFGTCASILAAYTRTLPDLSELKDERNREILEEGDEAEES